MFVGMSPHTYNSFLVNNAGHFLNSELIKNVPFKYLFKDNHAFAYEVLKSFQTQLYDHMFVQVHVCISGSK